MPIRIPQRTPAFYAAVVTAGLTPQAIPTGVLPTGARALLIYDDGVPVPKVDRASEVFVERGVQVLRRVRIRDAERGKSMAGAQALLAQVAEAKLTRGDVLIALGGGALTDLVGFVASTYRRGIATVLLPSTLLAMVDAAVGGKTAVNLALPDGTLIKNAVGTFHQPALVVADVSLLESLPPREFASGLAECIKHAMIERSVGGDGTLLAHTRTFLQSPTFDNPLLPQLIRANIALKAGVVQADPYEADNAGGRALLNFGHTFGHALETTPGLNLLHGEAVGLGMLAAARCARLLNLCGPDVEATIEAMLTAAQLPTRVMGVDAADVRERMGHDKKNTGGALRLVLPSGVGTVCLKQGADDRAVCGGIEALGNVELGDLGPLL